MLYWLYVKPFFKNHQLSTALFAAVCTAGFAVFVGLLIPTTRTQIRHTVEAAMAHLSATSINTFPEVSDLNLTPLQRKIVAINKVEYAKNPSATTNPY